jgi:hypothetical protein
MFNAAFSSRSSTCFRDEAAGPLGLDFWIGLPEDQESRTAQMILQDPPSPDDPVTPFNAAMMDPTSIQALVVGNRGGHMTHDARPGRRLRLRYTCRTPR